jgi:hypothetical protein
MVHYGVFVIVVTEPLTIIMGTRWRFWRHIRFNNIWNIFVLFLTTISYYVVLVLSVDTQGGRYSSPWKYGQLDGLFANMRHLVYNEIFWPWVSCKRIKCIKGSPVVKMAIITKKLMALLQTFTVFFFPLKDLKICETRNHLKNKNECCHFLHSDQNECAAIFLCCVQNEYGHFNERMTICVLKHL